MLTRTVTSSSPEETINLGIEIGRVLKPGTVILLSGELGSGKTVLTKGMAQGLGVETPDLVTSPSFVIMNIYPARLPIYHIDLYRVNNPREVEDIGLDEYIDGDGVAVVEWGDYLPASLLPANLDPR